MDMKITNLRKFIKYNKEVFVDGYKFGKASAIMDSTLLSAEWYMDGEFEAYESDVILHGKLGFLMSGVVRLYNGEYFIYTDSHFNKLSKETKLAIMNHETGHIELDHYKDTFKRDSNLEIEADKYMVSKVGKDQALNALKEIKEYTINNLGFYSKELVKRIEAIEAMEV